MTELRSSWDITNALLESAPDATICVDSGGWIVLVNAQAERLFGYRREDLTGQPVEILVPDTARAAHPALRAGYADDPRPRAMGAGIELSGRRRDGSTFPAEISLSAIDTGEGILVSAAVRDVTERRTAAMMAARLTAIIESSHDAMISYGLDGLVTSWNPGAERLYGYSAAEMIGRSSDVLIPAWRRAGAHEVLGALARGERVEQYQTEGVRKDGTVVALSVAMSPVTDGKGTMVGASSVTRDVTAQQRADARFRGLLEAAPDAVVCVDSSGRIVLVNAQAEHLFGYLREDLTGQPVEILVPDAARARHVVLRAGYADDPRPRAMDARVALSGRRRDGSTFPAEISLSAIDTDEGILVSAAVRDVTEQRRRQDEVRRGYRNLESFAYSVAHDLRTPLRAIAGFSAALLEDCGDSLGEVGRGYAARIEDASLHMSALIDSILQLSHVSRAEISLQAVDLGAEAASIAKELHRDSPGRRVRFTIKRPAWAMADRILVRLVLQNLLENAWKFTAGRGGAAIEFGTMPVTDGRICCYVRDNGAGFDFAYVDRLFRPFQRLHTTREFAGTGVGLASVRQIVERHGGRAWAEGAVGDGATFYFTLPATELT